MTGRPKIEIDYKELKKLCSIQCTKEEIADWFDCSEDTIERRIKEKYELTFADFFKKYSVAGKISLRRNQFKLAKKSVAMSIWLGKQYLGQRDYNKQIAVDNKENWTEKRTIYGMPKDAI